MISIVICTYNRAALLPTVLESACAQRFPADAFEIIVVDNHSTDGTRAVVESFVRQYSNVRYCYEPQQGIAAARNRGWREARGSYIAYTDDDCKLPPDWLPTAQRIIEQYRPLEFGGPTRGYFTGSRPVWWQDKYDAEHTFDGDLPKGYLPAEREIYGTNLFLKRELFDQVGGFDPEFGVCADKLAYGDETEMHARICRFIPGHRAYFDPELYVYHLVRPAKLSPWWRLHSAYKHGHAGYRIMPGRQYQLRGWQYLPFVCYVGILFLVTIVASVLWRDRTRYPYWSNYLYEATHLHACVWRVGGISAATAGRATRLFGVWRRHGS